MIIKSKPNVQISKHFNSNEFICPCCGITGYDTLIIEILEKLFSYMKAYKIIITSGYRCNKYEMSLKGGVKNGYHTKFQAVDINVYKNATERYASKEICVALEDLGWTHGIGIITSTAVHIDSRENKYWFNEMNACKSIGNSFYEFYGIKKTSKIEQSLNKLASKGIVNNKEYWLEHYKDVAYLENLINQFSDYIDK